MYRTWRALVVEDHALQCEFAMALLRNLGLSDIQSAVDGEDALAILRKSAGQHDPVNLVLCDLRMPHMDGAEFLRHIKDEGIETTIILTSALDGRILSAAENLAKARDLNIVGALEKPLRIEELRHILKKAASRETRVKKSMPCPLRAPDLDRAIHNGETTIHFQPQISTRNGRMNGVEVLARWNHPELGLISPDFFVPLAEKEGLMSELTRHVLQTGLAQSAGWRRFGREHRVAINISVELLSDTNLPDMVEEIAMQEGLSPDSIVLEITESRGIANFANALEVLTRLRMKEFGLSIDDFGTGNSTLEQLRRFPFTELKIDKEYVAGAISDGNILVMLESTISMARKLGLRVIAEGVETREELRLVVRLGCDEVQGFFFARPMPASDLMPWLLHFRGNNDISANFTAEPVYS